MMKIYKKLLFSKKFFNIMSSLDGISWICSDSWLFFTINASSYFLSVFVLLAFHVFWGFIFREIFSSFKIFTILHRNHRLGQNSKKKIAYSVYESCNNFFWLKVYLPFLKEHLTLYLEGMKSILDWNLIVTTCAWNDLLITV